MADTVSKSERSRIMRAVKGKDTGPEMIVRRMVHAMGYRYRLHVRSLPSAPDMVLPRLRTIIFVNGCLWHLHRCRRCRIPSSRRRYWVAKLQRNAERDKRSQRSLQRAGWRTLVVWECQTTPDKRDWLAAKIERFLGGRSNSRRRPSP